MPRDPLSARSPIAASLQQQPAPFIGSRDRPSLGRAGIRILAQVPLFGALSRRHLARVAHVAEEVRFGAGRVVIQAGARGSAFFALVEGEAKVVRGTRNLARLGPGDFFGELAMLDGGPRTASVVAVTPLVTVRLSRPAFQKLIHDEPAIAIAIMAELARRIRGAQGDPIQ